MEMKSPRINLVIDRDKAAAVGLNATQIRERALRRASARSGRRPSTATPRSTACCSSSIRNIRGTPTRSRRSRSRRRRGALVPLEVGRRLQGDGRSAVDQPLRPAAVGVGLVRPASRACRSARRRRTSKQVADRMLPATITTSFEGSGQGVPAVDEQSRRCCCSSRSASSTSCSARSTRATSTRSRFSRACRRPASAR